MAHLTVQAIAYPVTKTKILPVWATDITGISNLAAIDVEGSINCNVSLNGIPAQYETVHLYYRPTGQLICKLKTDVNGNVTFNNLNRSSNLYYAVAYLKGPFVDPEKYNAIIFDLLQPV